jgi:hypothetical protein
MIRGSITLTALAVLIPVVGAVGLADSIAEGASVHRTASSSHPSTAKLQKEITALKKAIPKTYLSAAKAKKTYLSSAGATSKYLSKSSAASTYLTPSAAAAGLVNGNGYVQQGEANIANNTVADTQPLFTTRDGLTFTAKTNPAGLDTVQLQVQNSSGTIQYLTTGNSETTLLAAGAPTTGFPLGSGTNGKGVFVFSIVSSTAPYEIDTVTVGEQSVGGASEVWAQLVHTGS